MVRDAKVVIEGRREMNSGIKLGMEIKHSQKHK